TGTTRIEFSGALNTPDQANSSIIGSTAGLMPTLSNGILPWAVINGPTTTDNPSGLDFATYTSGSTGMAITAVPQSAYATSINDVPEGTNNALVRLTKSEAIGTKTVFAVLFANNTVTLSGTDTTAATLTVSSGLIGFGGTSDRISVANLQLGASGSGTDSLIY